MAIRGTFKLTGLEEYAKKIQEAGGNIDEAVKEAIKKSAKPILDDMKKGAEPHSIKYTGKVLESLEISDIHQDGNFIYAEVGVNEEMAKDGAWVAVFQEYGSPTFSKDPFIRPSFDNNKLKVKKIQRTVLKKWGVPVK
jgi:HK97 gp10 family phage protein